MATSSMDEIFDKAMRSHQAGQLSQAEALYRAILESHPDHAGSLTMLGMLLSDSGRADEAIETIGKALALHPEMVEAHINLGSALRRIGRGDEAVASFRRAIALAPAALNAHFNLGNALMDLDRSAEAAECYREAVRLAPEMAECHYGLGRALRLTGQFEEAIAALRQAIALRADHAAAYDALGSVACDLGQWPQAIAFHGEAIRLDPQGGGYHTNLGIALYNSGELLAAEGCFRWAIGLREDDVLAHFNLAAILLRTGRLAQGWQEYEWRRRLAGFPPLNTTRPEWQGEPLDGKTILLYGEQGLGDTLQFARYAVMASEAGARVVLAVQPALVGLLRSVPGVTATVALGETTTADCHLPLLSAPRVFGTEVSTIPAPVPYITADPGAAARWGERLAGAEGLKVGLVWAGDPRPGDRGANLVDRRRSLRLEQFAPLGAIPGVTLVSLQKGTPAAQIKSAPEGLRLIDLMDEVRDFGDTAALVANLDLVICVDTSVAHLVGAMGKPVWILSRFDGCWRWLLDRDDSPWYPSARLFRQITPGDWTDTVAEVAAALRRLAQTGKAEG